MKTNGNGRRFGRTSVAIALMAVMTVAGCTSSLRSTEIGAYPAEVGAITPQNRALRDVPPPTRRTTVAVYDFPDLTGQYEEKENAQTLSRAVTQGGAPILIKALQDAGERRWFTVLDRSELEELLRERQIITEMRRIYRGEEQLDPSALPPLAHAGIILQGGIIGYDSNIATGGYGARLLGIGGDKKWKLDVVTVSLRAVSTATGEVLASVVVRKPVASISDRGGAFLYVELDKLLEAEAGRTTNEVRQVAVEQAVEKAVMALIAEGAQVDLWDFRNDSAGTRYIAGYLNEKFDGAVPATARNPLPPVTREPARVVQTRPVAQVERVSQVQVRELPAPAAQEPAAPPPPPPAGPDEVVG